MTLNLHSSSESWNCRQVPPSRPVILGRFCGQVDFVFKACTWDSELFQWSWARSLGEFWECRCLQSFCLYTAALASVGWNLASPGLCLKTVLQIDTCWLLKAFIHNYRLVPGSVLFCFVFLVALWVEARALANTSFLGKCFIATEHLNTFFRKEKSICDQNTGFDFSSQQRIIKIC